MNARTKILVASAASAAILLSGAPQNAFAQGASPGGGLADQIAAKFNLKPANVQIVMQQYSHPPSKTK